MEFIDILAVAKILVCIWTGVLVFIVYRSVKKAADVIPQFIFEKGKQAVKVSVKIPNKTAKFVAKKICKKGE